MLKEFKEFVMRGNVVDMAVGIIKLTPNGSLPESNQLQQSLELLKEKFVKK